MGWTAGKNKWDGWCNIKILVQRDELLKINEMVQQLWLVQRDGMDSQHDKMGWLVQHDGMDSQHDKMEWMVQHRNIGATR